MKLGNLINKYKVWIVIISLIVIVGGCASLFISSEEQTTKTKSVEIGEEGKLHQEGYDDVIMCTTKDYLDELTDAKVAKDKIGWNELFNYKCYMASGRVLVLDRSWGATKFRFIEPESPHYGKTAWTYMERIVPI